MAKKATRKRERAARPVRETAAPAAVLPAEAAIAAAPAADTSVAPIVAETADRGPGRPVKYASGENLKLGLMHDGQKFLVGDWQPKTIKKFRRLAGNTPELQKLGGPPVAEQPAALAIDELPDEAIGAIFGAVGAVGRWALARSGKLSAEQLAAVGYTAEQITALTPLTKRVIAKRLPSGALEYSDEIALAMAMIEMLRSNVERATPARTTGPSHVVQHPSASAGGE